MQNGQIRRVPGMLKTYIERDAWTKLNVKPAKIMIQDKVISELSAHRTRCAAIGNLEEQEMTDNMLQFLKSLNRMFENGFLCHTPCFSEHADPCKNIEKGFGFFLDWLDFLKNEPNFRQASPVERRFLSWQTFLLLKISVAGFRGVVRFMTDRHPGYFVAPLKLNGSAIESLFSRLKYQAGGKLSSLNYGSTRDSVVVMERTRPPASEQVSFRYRSEHLHFHET